MPFSEDAAQRMLETVLLGNLSIALLSGSNEEQDLPRQSVVFVVDGNKASNINEVRWPVLQVSTGRTVDGWHVIDGRGRDVASGVFEAWPCRAGAQFLFQPGDLNIVVRTAD